MEVTLAAVLEQQERTAAWLGRRAGKSTSYVTRVLRGQRRPSEEFKARAAEALGVPVAMLFPEPPVIAPAESAA